MLIDKLNYLVDKSVEPDQKGGLLHAYQLTEKFDSFQKLGKQSGFLFYVPAWNTSKIDPTTGFVNLFDTRYVNKEKTQTFISKFDSIIYNADRDCFDFSFDYQNFTEKAAGSQTQWCICTEGERLEYYKNPNNGMKGDVRKINLTELFKKLFDTYQISWKEGNLVDELEKVEETEFYRSFLHFLSLVLKMRNSNTKTDEDWLISPVRNQSGKCFKTVTTDEKYPCDADANGAYNIAKKGLWIVEQIQKTQEEQLDKVKLAISNKEWLAYAQEHRL
jgi:CRISPR-associated protein Cpf1